MKPCMLLARRQERRAEQEKVEQMCELMEKELRFMTVDDGEQYTVPSLELLEHNLEAAMHKVRSEKDRKIGGEINFLENIVRTVSRLLCTPVMISVWCLGLSSLFS